jgi:hypothetical protein
MAKPFRYQRAENFDQFLPLWHVTHKATESYIGDIKGAAANNYEVRRPQDKHFNLEFGSKREAARWLKEKLPSKAIFDEDEDEPNDETST